MNIDMIQQDLRNGLTLEQTLQKHQVTLLELWHTIHYKPKKKKQHSTGEKYINKHQNKYTIQKKIGGKPTYFGRYDTLEDAKLMKTWLDEHGWDTSWKAQRRRFKI